jgi:hypothetical protein
MGPPTQPWQAVAQKIIDLAKAGERDPERLCGEALRALEPIKLPDGPFARSGMLSEPTLCAKSLLTSL